MKQLKLLDIGTSLIMVLSLLIMLSYLFDWNFIQSKDLVSILTGFMVLAIGIQIYSSNLNFRKLIPDFKLIDSFIEYKLENYNNESYIWKWHVHLVIVNETNAPIYIQMYRVDIGKINTRTYHRFPLKSKDKNLIEWQPNLVISPNESKDFDIVDDNVRNSLYSQHNIEAANKEKIFLIQKADIILVGNFGEKKFKIDFYQSNERF